MITKLIFWITTLVLILYTVNAESAVNEKLINNTILYYTGDVDNIDDNSTFENDATVTDGTWTQQTTKFQVGDGAVDALSSTGTLTFSHISTYNTYNFSVCVWTNASTPVGSNGAFISYADSGSAPFWYIFMRTDGQMNFNRRFAGGSEPTININVDVSAYKGTMFQYCVSLNDSIVDVSASTAAAYVFLNGSQVATATNSPSGQTASFQNFNLVFGQTAFQGNAPIVTYDEVIIWNKSLTSTDIQHTYELGKNGTTLKKIVPIIEDTSPPEIISYNLTSEGGEGCTNWNTDKNNACETSDTTPTVFVNTDEDASCRIGVSDLNFTDMGASRNCAGSETKDHTCTLTTQDELTSETSFVYIGCQDLDGRENLTSTSGSLKISIINLETSARNAMESGIQHALGSDYTIYTDQKLYARNSANNQFVTTFDKVVKWFNKIWAFNFLTGNQTATDAFNITPILYVLEMTNVTNSTVNSTVYQLILDTK
jgi:hypothetical protein